MAPIDDLITELRVLVLESVNAGPADEARMLDRMAILVSELDLRLACGDRLPTDWRSADRRTGDERRHHMRLVDNRRAAVAV